MSRTPRVDAFIAAKDIFCDSDELFDFLNFAANLEQMLDAALASNKQLAEANRKLAERINDDQRYLVAPLCNAEKALDDCQEELAEARAEIDWLTLMATNASMEPARRLIQKNKELQAVIEQMREALRLALPEARSTHVEQTILAALAAERGE